MPRARVTGRPVSRRRLLQYAASAGVWALSPRLRAAVSLRVGVVGGGIVGASIAMHLAEAGAQVMLFERTEPAAGATQNSFAWVNIFTDDAHYRELRTQSLLAYRELDRRLNLGLVWGGYLNWGQSTDEVATVRANIAMLEPTPYPMRQVSAAQVAKLDPQLKPGAFAAAAFSSIDAHLDPVAVTHRYLEQATAHEAEVIFPCEVHGLELDGGRLKGVHTTRGPFRLDRLVIAAGVDTPTLTAMAGSPLRLKHAPGILAHSAALLDTTRLVHDAPGGLSFKQMGNGSVVATDAPHPPDIPAHHEIRTHAMAMPHELAAQHGERILAKVAPFLPGNHSLAFERLTLGFRPIPLDEFPVVGALPQASGVYVAVTHSGVTLAPILGRLATQELLTGERAPLLAPYRPERFG